MRIPGIRNIGYCPAASVPAEFEMQGMAGIAVNIAGLSFTALYVLDDGVLEISDSNEHNGSNQKVSLTFTCLSEFKPGRYVFLVQTVAGVKWLIGGKASVPAVSTQDTTAAAGSANGLKVTVELSAPIAAQRVIGQESICTAEGFVTFEDWRQVADATYSKLGHTHTKSEITDFTHTHTKSEITDFSHRHDTDEVDDENFDKSQDEVNQNLLELAYAGL